jgi:hypothetical protein
MKFLFKEYLSNFNILAVGLEAEYQKYISR